MSAEPTTSSRRAGRAGFFASPPPAAALEIARDRVSAVAVSQSGAQVTGYAVEPRSPGIVDSVLIGPNVLDQARLVPAIQSVLSQLGSRARRMALVRATCATPGPRRVPPCASSVRRAGQSGSRAGPAT